MLARWLNRAKATGFRPSCIRKNRSGNAIWDKQNTGRNLLLRSGLTLCSANASEHLFQRLPQNQTAFAEKLDFLGPQLDLVAVQATVTTDDRRDAQRDVANV